MIEVNFSVKNTGACSLCKRKKNCLIHTKIKNALENSVSSKNDNKMELVIYQCPMFSEG